MKKLIKIGLLLVPTLLVVVLLVTRSDRMPRVKLTPLFQSELIDSVVFIGFSNEPSQKMVLAKRSGALLWGNPDDSKLSGTLLDIQNQVHSGGHCGLQSFVFDPHFDQNRFIYVFYDLENPYRARVSRFTVGDKFVADPSSELVIVEIQKEYVMHSGGQVAFGDDGYLYVAFGEGYLYQAPTSKLPKPERLEILRNRSTLLGSVVRLDVSSSTKQQPYKIPPDNPFVGKPGRPEIYANGLRNPWRFSFDRETKALLLSDVGNHKWEEVDLVKKGEDYGWPAFEGKGCHGDIACQGMTQSEPYAVFSHKYFGAIVGGFVYRGQKIDRLKGQYVFGGYGGRGRGLYSFPFDPNIPVQQTDGLRFELYKADSKVGPNRGTRIAPVGFAEDKEGELFLVDLNGGIYRIDAASWFYMARGLLSGLVR